MLNLKEKNVEVQVQPMFSQRLDLNNGQGGRREGIWRCGMKA